MTHLELHPRHLATIHRVLLAERMRILAYIKSRPGNVEDRIASDALTEVNVALVALKPAMQGTPNADELLRKMREGRWNS